MDECIIVFITKSPYNYDATSVSRVGYFILKNDACINALINE